MIEFDEYLETLQKLDSNINRNDDKVSIQNALNRVLSREVSCKYNIPQFDNSAMDGYAINTLEGQKYKHIYKIIDDYAFAGNSKEMSIFDNEALKIATGAKLPNNANAVIQKELAVIQDDKLLLESVPKSGANIKFMGYEFKKGEKLLDSGINISFQDITTLASQGFESIYVRPKVNIIIFSSGSEIVDLGKVLGSGQIYNINSILLTYLLSSCDVSYGGILPDCEDSIYAKLKEATTTYDIVVTTGGASVGDRDFILNVLHRLQADILINGVNIKPGKPLMLSKVGEKFIFSLPGNPIAAVIHCLFGVKILAQKLSNAKCTYPRTIDAINTTSLKLKKGVTNVVLGNFNNGEFSAFNGGKYQASQIIPLSRCDCVALFHPHKESCEVLEKIKILPFNFDFLDTISIVRN